MAGTFVPVARSNEITVGEFKPVAVNGKRLLICHTQEGFFAVDDTCTHDDGPLADGWLEGTAIECPRHGARFDVKTGRPVTLPAILPVKTFQVKLTGEDLFIEL